MSRVHSDLMLKENVMKLLNSLFVCCALATLPTSVFAADPPAAGSITIMSPANDAALQSGKGNKLEFNPQR